MAQLAHIKNRISTIQKTQKITKAMRMIAMSLYSKLEKQRTLINAYRVTTSKLTGLLFNGRALLPAQCSPRKDAQTLPTLLIVCSSAKGLCGGLNNNLIKFFERSLIGNRASDYAFIAIGGKSCSYLHNTSHGTLVREVPEYSFNTIAALASSLVDHILTSKTPYASVGIVYTHLKNFFIQTPTQVKLLPFEEEESTGERKEAALELTKQDTYLWEEDPAALGNALLRQHLYTEITYALFNNIISENAARFIAMDQSTNNAKKYLEALSLAYNKSRQNLITREIAELSSTF